METIMRTFKNIILALFMGIFLTACTSLSMGDVLRSELQLSSNIYRVEVAGPSSLSHQRVIDFALLRAAEIVLARDGKRFVVIENTIVRITRELTSDPFLLSTITLPDGSVQTTYSPAETSTYTRSQGTLVIEIVRASDARYSSAHDAQLIASQLRPLLLPEEDT